MLITDKKKIKEVQKEFSNKFPFLKIKFYKHPHSVRQGSKAAEEWSSDLTLGEIKSTAEGSEFSIADDMRIQEFETQLEENFGLHVQVFRASTNNVWLQTVATDEWTLLAANQKSEAMLAE